MRIGARRFERSFLLTHKKLISTNGMPLRQAPIDWLVGWLATIQTHRWVYLDIVCIRVVGMNSSRDGRDESKELVLVHDTNVPVLQIARWSKSPCKSNATPTHYERHISIDTISK
jgi:hypothetical protein